MLLLSNILYQFVFAQNRGDSQSDPERGPEVDSDELEAVDSNLNGIRENPIEGDIQDLTHDIIEDDPDDNFAADHRHSENNVSSPAQGVQAPPKGNLAARCTSSLSPSTWWTRLRDWWNSRTSQGDLESYAPHYRYMPILSGIIIPFSILLEIPGITEHWYIRTEDRSIVEDRPNTTILDVGLGFSIGFAALANLALIIRFLEMKVKTMTFVCILSLTVHDVINIITVTIFGVEHRFDDGFTYGPAFWMTVCSTSVSSMTNVTLILDFFLTPNFSSSGSGLTRKQRTLVISVMALLTYIAFGALVQAYLMGESFINALYFTVVSIETIGFGDITPDSTGSRVFTCIFSVFGILILALTVGLTRETVLEGLEVGYIQRARDIRQRRRQHDFERRVSQRWTNAIEWRLRRAGKTIWVPDGTEEREFKSGWCSRYQELRHELMKLFRGVGNKMKDLRHGHGYEHPHGMRLNLEGLKWAQLEAAAMEAGVPLHTLLPPDFQARDGDQDESWRPPGSETPKNPRDTEKAEEEQEGVRVPLTHARLGRMIAMLGRFALVMDASSFAHRSEQKEEEETQRLDVDIARVDLDLEVDEHGLRRMVSGNHDSLRASMEREELKAFYVRLAMVWVVFLLFWMIGSVVFMSTEKWTFGIALYFCFISFTTIGYGDYTPVTPAGRSIFVFWALLGVATMTILISTLSDRYSSRYKSIFRSGQVSTAVKRYQERARAGMIVGPSTSPAYTFVPVRGPDTGSTYVQAVPSSPNSPISQTALHSPIHIDRALSESHKRATKHLESLPGKVLRHAKTFGEDAKYLIKSETLEHGKEEVPDGLKKLMEDVAGVERLSERIKKEILGDTDARHALLAISIGDALHKIIESAEEAVEALKERDRLTELKSPPYSINQQLQNDSADEIS